MHKEKLYMYKQYDQLRRKKIGDTCINFYICDYQFNDTEKIFAYIKEENDSDETIRRIQLRKQDIDNYIFDFPFNKNAMFELQIKICDSQDTVLEESARQTFYYDGLVFDEDDIQSHPQFDLVQHMLRQLGLINGNVEKAIDEYLMTNEMGVRVDNFINLNQARFDRLLYEDEVKVDNFINLNQTRFDTLLHEDEVKLANMQQDINTVISQLSSILDEFLPVEEVKLAETKVILAEEDERVICINTNEIYKNNKEASKETGVNAGSIKKCCNGNSKSAGKDENGNKLIWKYCRDVGE